jgi:hypothetical protein
MYAFLSVQRKRDNSSENGKAFSATAFELPRMHEFLNNLVSRRPREFNQAK